MVKMNLKQDYKVISNLKKMIQEQKLPKAVKKTGNFFDIESLSYTIESQKYNLFIDATKETYSVYQPVYSVVIKDQNYQILNNEVVNGILSEHNSRLAKSVFNQLQKYYKRSK